MKRFQLSWYAAAGIVGFGLVLPTGAMAAQPNATPIAARDAAAPSIIDVTLGEGGTLSGQVVDAQGVPMARTTVTLSGAGNDVASTVTDAQGSFSVAGVHGGMIEVNAAGGTSSLRVWTANASPPSANKSVLIVADGQVARGQSSIGPSIHLPTAGAGLCLPGFPSPAPAPTPIVCRPIICPPVVCPPPCHRSCS